MNCEGLNVGILRPPPPRPPPRPPPLNPPRPEDGRCEKVEPPRVCAPRRSPPPDDERACEEPPRLWLLDDECDERPSPREADEYADEAVRV